MLYGDLKQRRPLALLQQMLYGDSKQRRPLALLQLVNPQGLAPRPLNH
jgi:hypothetical protein